tara:strand:+ start:5957 stop:6445 length:489 start_codon:yes stop_codon:yes gene_type:complete
MNRLNDLRDLGIGIIKSIRASLTIYVIVSKNSIKVKNLENGKTASGESHDEFSTDRLLIADPMNAENFAKELINKVADLSDIRTRKLNVICHPIDQILADLSPVEKMIFNDFAYHIGGRYVYLIDNRQELTDIELNEIKTLLNSNYSKSSFKKTDTSTLFAR